MNSFLHRNITLNLFYNNGRNYTDFSPYSTILASSKSKEKKISKSSKIDDKIYYIFKIIYYKEFPKILKKNSKLFLRNVNTISEEIIQKNILHNNFTSEEIKFYIGQAKDKILKLYNEEFSFLKESFLNYQKCPDKYELLKDNTLIHCNKGYNQYIYHKCSNETYGNFISINKNREMLYVICIKCSNCYRNNYINLFCNICNEEYYGLIYKQIDNNNININRVRDRDVYLATWKNYHCGLINNEIMKCINCKSYLYYNIKTNKLICHNKNCKFTSDPQNIIWKCTKCSKDFNSEVKPFNPYEYRIFMKQLYYIVLSKNKAKPKYSTRCLNCDNIINKDIFTFYHNEKCKGEIYEGKIFNRDIVVCAKCLFVKYYEEFVWTCPICKNKITKNKETTQNRNFIPSIQIKNSYSLQTKTFTRYNRIKHIQNYLSKDKDNKLETLDSNNDNSKYGNKTINNDIDNYDLKSLSNFKKEKPIRALLKLEKEKNIKNFLRNVNVKYNTIEKDSNISLSKLSLNDSNSSNFTSSMNPLKNRDKKKFHSIIMKMKNRMLNSRKKDKFIKSSEEKIKSNNDNILININNEISRNVYKPNKFISLSNIQKEEKNIKIRNGIKFGELLNKNENENKSNEKEKSKPIFARKALSRKHFPNKSDIGNNRTEIINSNNNITISQIGSNSLRNKFKYKKKENNTIIKPESKIYDKEKTTKIGSFYIRGNNQEKNKKNLKDNQNDFKKNIINKINKYRRKNVISDNINKDKYNLKLDGYEINDTTNNKCTTCKMDNNNYSTIDNQININKFENKRYKRKFNLNTFKKENKINIIKSSIIKFNSDSKNIIKDKENINIKENKINYKIDKKINNENNKQAENNNIKDYSKPIKKSILYSKKKNKQNVNDNDSQTEKKKKIKFAKESVKTHLSNNFLPTMSDNFIPLNKVDSDKEVRPKKAPFSFRKKFSKSRKDLIVFNPKEDSVSNLIKKNLEEFFDKKDDIKEYGLKRGKSQNYDKINSDDFQKLIDDNFEKRVENNNEYDMLGYKKNNNDDYNLYEDDDEGKKNLINEINIKKVIQHFARKNSVVKILREIGNEDNINSKENKQEKEYNHFVLEGLINHVNLISSPEKISLLEKNSSIPIFSDDEYFYYDNIGEGANANIYLIKDKKTNKEYAMKKMVCQEFNDLVKIKHKLEIIYSLDHENIMKVKKIQFKCLDFTTYAINIVMDKALTDWNNEIKQRAKNNKYYTEKELLNIANQIINGLAFLQQKNIAHRDIKPQNILIFPNKVYKIADLGEMINDIKNFEKQLTIKGSSIFLSPVLIDGLKHNQGGVKHNAYKSDVFSLGYCFLYAMSLSMEILEQARECWGGNKDYKHIEIDIKKYIGNDRYSNKFIDFIGKMILEDENKREDFFGLKKELEMFDE